MDFRHVKTGTIYHVTNKELLSIYEGSPLFKRIEKAKPAVKVAAPQIAKTMPTVEKAESKPVKKKTTTKRKTTKAKEK